MPNICSISSVICLIILNLYFRNVAAENLCSANGDSFSYDESFVIDTNNVTVRRIVTNSCPNHYNNCQRDTCSGSSSIAQIKIKTIDVPATPIITSDDFFELSCIYGTVGIALNGVSIFSKRAKGAVCTDAILAEGVTFDKCGGHADAETHEYHYHIAPSCLLKQLNYTGSLYQLPSAQIGWALDGFPIYGPTGPFGIAMLPCGACGADSVYCLDSCNGYYGRMNGTNAVDGFLYRYYMTGQVSTTSCSAWVHGLGECEGVAECCASTVPSSLFRPYTINCLRGCTMLDSECHHRNHTVGTVSGYSPYISEYPETVLEETIYNNINKNKWEHDVAYPSLNVPEECIEEDHEDYGKKYISETPRNPPHTGYQASNSVLLVLIGFVSFSLCLVIGLFVYISKRSYQSVSGTILSLWMDSDIEPFHACGISADDNIELRSRHSDRSDESIGSGAPLDEIAVNFDDHSTSIFSCIDIHQNSSNSNSSDSRHGDNSDECLPLSSCLPSRQQKYAEGNEDDTPWAI